MDPTLLPTLRFLALHVVARVPHPLFPVVLEALRTKRMKHPVPSPIPRLLQSLPPLSLPSPPLLSSSSCPLSLLSSPSSLLSFHFVICQRSFALNTSIVPHVLLSRRVSVSSLPPRSSRCLTTTQPDLSSVLWTLSVYR